MAIRNALQGLVIILSVWFNRHIRIAFSVRQIYKIKTTYTSKRPFIFKYLLQKKLNIPNLNSSISFFITICL
jgi:hypothetical protein